MTCFDSSHSASLAGIMAFYRKAEIGAASYSEGSDTYKKSGRGRVTKKAGNSSDKLPECARLVIRIMPKFCGRQLSVGPRSTAATEGSACSYFDRYIIKVIYLLLAYSIPMAVAHV